MNHLNEQNGITLIEVLIALSIISIALTAVIKASSQNIRATTYLQNKQAATWLAQKTINEFRSGALDFRGNNDIKGHNKVGHKSFFWQAMLEKTQNLRIKKIIVAVYEKENDNQQALVQFETYVYLPQMENE